MTEEKFRFVVGVAIVLSHVVLMLSAFLVLLGKMEIEKVFSTIFILAPIFGIFASQVVNFANQNFTSTATGLLVNPLFSFIFLILYVGHFVLVGMIFFSYAYWQLIATPEALQQAVGIAETAFGFMIGLMITRVFGEAPAGADARKDRARDA